MSSIILIGKYPQGEAALQWQLPLNPKSWKVGILSHFPDMDNTPGKGNSPSSNDLGLSHLLYNPSCFCDESLLHMPFTMATLSGYRLVVCDKFYKENASWQLVPPQFLHPNHVLMAECPCNSKSWRSSWAVSSPPFLCPFSCPCPSWLTALGLVLGCCARCLHTLAEPQDSSARFVW